MWTVIVAILASLIVAGIWLASLQRGDSSPPNPAAPATEGQPEKGGAGPATEGQRNPHTSPAGEQWRYWRNEDAMSGQKTSGAMVSSTNTHSFEFPYAGAQNARLALRRHPRHGNDVIMMIEKGQLQCPSYSGCKVIVRFGDQKPRSYIARGPSDGSSESFFIDEHADFQRRMQAVDILRIQASIYRQGSPVWEFNVVGFDPEKLK